MHTHLLLATQCVLLLLELMVGFKRQILIVDGRLCHCVRGGANAIEEKTELVTNHHLKGVVAFS